MRKPQTGKQKITIHILPNISRIKSNHTLKFVMLIEYNMRNIVLERSHASCDREASSRLFHKKSKLSLSLYPRSKMLCSLFLLYLQVEVYQILLKLRCWPLALTLYKAFLKNKMRSGTSLPASFFAWFLKKNISHVMVYYLTKFHCLIAFASWDFG